MMRAYWSHVNQAWLILYGNAVNTASIISIDGQRLFSMPELESALRSKGLRIDDKGIIHSMEAL